MFKMYEIGKTGLIIGLIGGIGLGLLLGAEYSFRYTTIIGAVLVCLSLSLKIYISFKNIKTGKNLK